MSSESSRCSDAALAWNERRATSATRHSPRIVSHGSKGQLRAVEGERSVLPCAVAVHHRSQRMVAWEHGRMAEWLLVRVTGGRR